MSAFRRVTRRLVTIAAASVLAAIGLPLVGVSAAGASTSPSLYCSQLAAVTAGQSNIFGSPYCGPLPWGTQNSVLTFNVYGANLGFDNGAVSATTTASGVTVLSVTENNTFSATVVLAIGASQTPGYFGLSITDGNGTSTLATAFGVDPAATITSYTPTSVPEGSVTLITVTGTGLMSGTVSRDAADPAGFTIVHGDGVANAAGTSLTFFVSTSASLALGTYGVDIPGVNTTNIDGNQGLNITVTGAAVYSVSPSEYVTNPGPAVASTLTITGAGFVAGAIVTIDGLSLSASPVVGLTFGPVNSVTSTTITIPVTNASTDITVQQWTVTVTDPGGTTSTFVGAIGWNEPGLATGAGAASLTLNDNELVPGPSTITVTGSAAFPMSLGNVVTLSLDGFTFSGVVVSVSAGNEAVIAFDLPADLNTKTTAATIALATSIPVASLAGIPLGNNVQFVDDGDVTVPSGVVPSTVTMTIPAAAHAHASGTPIQWAISEDNGWTLTVNDGTSLLSLSGLNIGAQPVASLSYINTAGNSVVLSNDTATNPMSLAPGTYTVLLSDPGANLGTTGNTVVFDQNGGDTNPAGITGTIVATSADTAWVTLTMPGASSVPAYTEVNVNDYLTTQATAGQDTISLNAVTGLTAGDTYELGNGPSLGGESFTISPTWAGGDVVNLVSPLPLTEAIGTFVYSISFAQTFGVDYNASIFSSNGTVNTIPFLVTMAPFLLSGINDVDTGLPASPGMILGSGATNVTVYIYGTYADVAPTDYIITSTTPGVTFGTVTAANGGFLTATVSIAAGTPVNTNVEYTVIQIDGTGTVSLPSSAQVNSGFLIGNTPTVTAVTGLPAVMIPGESSTFTVTGTLLDAATVTSLEDGGTGFLATTGNTPGYVDLGTRLGYDNDGTHIHTCTLNSSTSITCTLTLDKGAINGPQGFMVTNAEYGTATLNNVVTVSNATIGTISPTVFQNNGDTVPFTLGGLTQFVVTPENTVFNADGTVNEGLSTPEPTMVAAVTTYFASGAEDGLAGGLNVYYAGPNSVIVNVPDPPRPPGGLMTVTLYQDSSVTGYRQGADAPAIPLGEPLLVNAGPVAALPAGTSSPFAVVALPQANPAPFNGKTTFLKGATVTAPAGSGVTVSGLTVLPGLITGTVAVAAGTPAGVVILSVINPDGGISYTTILVTPSPIITSVDGIPVPFGVGFLNGTSTTLVIGGLNFEQGAVVSAGTASDATFGATTVNGGGTVITVAVTFTAVTGATPVITNLIVTNPDGGVGVAYNELFINPAPVITGGPYYVPTFTTDTEVVLTGTGLQQGLTVASSNAAYSVSIANVSLSGTAVTLLVTTSSAATSGTSSTLTLTNPDGGTTTATLLGGPVPQIEPHAIKVTAPVYQGRTTTTHIVGSHFSGQPTITSNVGGTKVGVSGDSGTVLTLVVKVSKNTPNGVHNFKIVFSNGFVVNVHYNQKAWR